MSRKPKKDKRPGRIPSPKMWGEKPPSAKTRSLKQERRISDEMGFTPTIMSGALESLWQKEDGFDEEYQVQMKTTRGQDARIVSRTVLHTLTRRAYELGKDPLLVLSFEDAEVPMPEDWVMMPKHVLMKLREDDAE